MTITPPASSTNTPTRGPRSPSSPGMDLDAPSGSAAATGAADASVPPTASGSTTANVPVAEAGTDFPTATAAPAAPSTPPPASAPEPTITGTTAQSGGLSGVSTASASATGSAAPASPRSEGDPIDVDEPEGEAEAKRPTSGPGTARNKEQLPDAWLVDRWNKDLGDLFVPTRA